MTLFLLEAYFPSGGHDGSPNAEELAEAADLVTRSRSVRLVHTLVVPEDETCFYLFEAESISDVEETASRAGLRLSAPARHCQLEPREDRHAEQAPAGDLLGRTRLFSRLRA
jgi:hypothetical protein